MLKYLSLVILLTMAPLGAEGIPAPLAQKIGQRIWQNECAGTVSGLTSWNGGEYFASLGIAHFIWYPEGVTGPYEESFPGLVKFLASRRAKVPGWLLQGRGCPWRTRAAFHAAQKSPPMNEIRALLTNTIGLQAEYAAMRSAASLPKMLGALPRGQRAAVEAKYRALSASGAGLYCLIDYVNFKGEGTNPAERYRGQGWGLLQVLQEMQTGTTAEFAAASRRVLARRISLAPKDETRWQKVWFSRCNSYARGL